MKAESTSGETLDLSDIAHKAMSVISTVDDDEGVPSFTVPFLRDHMPNTPSLIIRYAVDRLLEMGFVRPSGIIDYGLCSYYLEPKGRTYIIEHGMAS